MLSSVLGVDLRERVTPKATVTLRQTAPNGLPEESSNPHSTRRRTAPFAGSVEHARGRGFVILEEVWRFCRDRDIVPEHLGQVRIVASGGHQRTRRHRCVAVAEH